MRESYNLPLLCHGHAVQMHVSLGADRGWDVATVVDGHEIARTHYEDWHRVERHRSRLQAQLLRRKTHLLEVARSLPALTLAVLLLVLAVPALAARQSDDGMKEFQRRVGEYLAVRGEARAAVAPEHIIDPRIREIGGPLFAAQLRLARRRAQIGDLFPAAVSGVIRDRLHRAFDDTEVDAMLTGLYPGGLPPVGTARLHATFGRDTAVMPPTSVLAALPPVPGVLGYRLVGRDLVLWDEEACLVVDLVSDALPLPRVWNFVDTGSLELRALVRRTLAARGIDARALLEDAAEPGVPCPPRPVVGDRFSWESASMMPPSLLHVLPPLAPPLEYRLVGPDLVVIDVASGIVRGVLPDAIAVRRGRGRMPL